MRRNEKKGNVIKLQKDGRGNKVANSHYRRKHTLTAPSKKRASTLRHKYKILDALKLTWQIGIPQHTAAQLNVPINCCWLRQVARAFPGLRADPPKKLTVQQYYIAHIYRQGRNKIRVSLSQDVERHYLMKSAEKMGYANT